MNSQQEAPVKITSYSFRNFVRRLNNAAIKIKYRGDQLREIGERMQALSGLTAEKKPDRARIDTEIEGIKGMVENMASQEKVLVVRQKTEQNELDEMKTMIKALEEKVEGLSHVQSMVTNSHQERLVQLQKALAETKSGEGHVHPKHYWQTKERVKHHPALVISTMKKLGAKKKREEINILQQMVREAEKTHAELKKKGAPKKHLARLKKRIEEHKKTLERIKK